MGTMIQQKNPTIDDWGGPKFENCTENLLFTRPDWVKDIHRAYFQAGADMVETDTFGGHPVTLGEFGLAERVHDVNSTAARLAREVADEFRGKFVAGSIGRPPRRSPLRAASHSSNCATASTCRPKACGKAAWT